MKSEAQQRQIYTARGSSCMPMMLFTPPNLAPLDEERKIPETALPDTAPETHTLSAVTLSVLYAVFPVFLGVIQSQVRPLYQAVQKLSRLV